MKKPITNVFLAVICAALGFMFVHQFKALNRKDKVFLEGERISSYYDITDENSELEKTKQNLEEENAKLLSELKQYEANATSNNRLTSEIKEQLDASRVMLGMTDVQGPGIVVSISPKSSIFNGNNNRYINYKELVYVINELYFAGAEAVSVNDNRIIFQSIIKASSNNDYIQVNDDKVSPKNKIVVKAIGDKTKLEDALTFPGVLDFEALSNYDIKIEKTEDIKMSKYNKPIKEEFINPVENKQ